MCVCTCESAFSWCLKKSSMMIDDRTGSLLDELSSQLSFEGPFHSSQEKIHCYTIVLKLNSSRTYTSCSNVRITLLLHMALKRNV